MLTEEQTKGIVEEYVKNEKPSTNTQELLLSNAVPRLKNYTVLPGKVSDSIFGGKGSFRDKVTGKIIEFENPPLFDNNGVPLRIMVRTDRISTHDKNRGTIPFKDQIIAANHDYMRKILMPFLGNSQFDAGLAENSVVIVAENLTRLDIEMVVRGFMAKSSTSTSLYQAYIRGERVFAGHALPEGLVVNGALPYVMDTPSTKSDEQDITLSPVDLIKKGACTESQYLQIKNSALVAFGVASYFFLQRGIIAVDTKTEHGINQLGEIVVQDEIWTMDSSRFWLADDYNEQLKKYRNKEIAEINPKSFSKEFARGFSEDSKKYTDEQRIAIAVRYVMGIQHLLGKSFEPDTRARDERVITGLQAIVERIAV